MEIEFKYKFKNLFLQRLAEFIYIEGDNKKSVSSAGTIHFIYNETIVSRDLPSSSVD